MLIKSIPPSPFVDNRKEREPSATKIFVNYLDYIHWTSYKNCLIQGSRGTGKSSILSIFYYETRWFNESIIVPSNELEKHFPKKQDIIGVLYKCEELERSLWERWSKSYRKESENFDSQIVFASFMNYYYIEKIVSAIIQIREKKEWVISDEDNIPLLISELYQACYPNLKLQPYLYDHSLITLRNLLEDTHSSLRQQIYSLTSYNVINENFTIHTASSCVIERICTIVRNRLPKFKDIKFFLLIDDVDRLEQWQLEVINSFITSSKEPCSFKMSCTGDYKTKVNTNNRTISTTDLHISKLNDESETENKISNSKIDELFNAIFNIRLSKIFDKNNYDLKIVFGENPIIESLLIDALKKSINPELKKLRADFEKSGYDRITDYWIDKNEIIDINADDHVKSKKYDQYRVSSVFSILTSFDIEKSFNYHSYDMIKMISSGSPRHFLRICDKMWNEIYTAIDNNTFPIKKEIQSKAITSASEDVFQNIEDDNFDGTIQNSCKRMCERLNEVFKKLISIESLKITPECLSLQIDESKFQPKDKETYYKIIDWLLIIEGIKTRKISDNVNKIALNPMLAPKFCLPFRSPFSYSYTIKEPIVLLNLLISEDEIANKLIERIYFDRIKNDQSLTLF